MLKGVVADLRFEKSIIATAKAFARSVYQYVYILDCTRRSIIYASGGFGFSKQQFADEICRMGFGFYDKYLVDEDLQMLRGFPAVWAALVECLPQGDASDYTLHCNMRIKDGDRTFPVHHTFTAVSLTESGAPHYVLCTVSLPVHRDCGHVRARKVGEDFFWEYDAQERAWRRMDCIRLRELERAVLLLAARGATVEEISRIVCRSADAVKTCKRKLFKRMGVSTIAQAISYAIDYQLI